jgi:phage terminase small subunit
VTLNDEQAKHWREIVAKMPAHWFRTEALQVLEAYCVQIERRRLLAAKLNAMEKAGKSDSRQYADLEGRENVAVRALIHLATKLRLTPQSAYDKTKKRTVALRNPWEERD